MNTSSPATLTVPEAAQMLGVAKNSAYIEAASTGELAGVPVIRVGRRLVIPRAPFEALLGLTQSPPEHESPTQDL